MDRYFREKQLGCQYVNVNYRPDAEAHARARRGFRGFKGRFARLTADFKAVVYEDSSHDGMVLLSCKQIVQPHNGRLDALTRVKHAFNSVLGYRGERGDHPASFARD